MTLSVKVSKKYPDFTLDIDFKIENGLSVLFGYSGAGKSLTLKMVSGLERPDKGSIYIDKRPLFDSKNSINVSPGKRSVGYMFQDHSLFPHMKIKDNILFGARNIEKSERHSKYLDFLNQFRIEGLENKYPHEISGGQKQRVAIAMALMGNPDVLLLDEPFSALDNPLRIIMRECLGGVMKRIDIPILLVTHDIFEAATLADKMFVFSNGKIIQKGTPIDIIKNPENSEVASLVKIPTLPKGFNIV
jgi:molybdate transport system ATP-binding protein